MITIGWPTETQFTQFLGSASSMGFSYHGEKVGFNQDDSVTAIGSASDFEKAKQLVNQFKVFDLGWAIARADGPIKIGTHVAVCATAFGMPLKFSNLARITELYNSKNEYGFKYVTLDDHIEKGEEIFLLSCKDDQLFYEIHAISRPNHILSWSFYPIVRALQNKFRIDSTSKMKSLLKEMQ